MKEAAEAKKYLTERDYKMEVLQDDGLFRHLKFMHNNCHNGYFCITTWPGHLCISGDMGTFVFRRINDMIEFFAGEGINPGYWSEKVQAESLFGDGIKSFNVEAFVDSMLEDLKAITPKNSSQEDQIAEAIESLRYVSDEYEAVDYMRRLNIEDYDACEFSWTDEYNFHYLFACYAINYACNTYLASKAENEA